MMELSMPQEIVLRAVAKYNQPAGSDGWRSAGCLAPEGATRYEDSLVREGLLSVRWLVDRGGGKLGRVYTLTAAGWRALEELPDDASLRGELRRQFWPKEKKSDSRLDRVVDVVRRS